MERRVMQVAVRRSLLCVVLVAIGALLAPSLALGHIERASYWPDPAPDCTITPCAGGQVPTPRSLASSVQPGGPGVTRVVCQKDSLKRLHKSVKEAKTTGYLLRPTQPRNIITRKEANALNKLNKQLKAKCAYSSIQDAVNASGNNDRVVIMPGLYTEPTSRASADARPGLRAVPDRRTTAARPGAVSYEYQFHCPNDQNLIAVHRPRARAPSRPPHPPLEDRHGIPDLGPCIRCNLQIEGSGVSADDVVDRRRPRRSPATAAPIEPAKDVGIRADRADGFVLRNVKVRHATEHDIYVLETDGYLLDRFKTFYAGEYGVLTFVEDHGLMQNCEAAGQRRLGPLPGRRRRDRRPARHEHLPEFRYSQEIRYCDSHHNAGGYSGTDGNATHVDHNNFYDNALGFTTDVFTAPGHPGFPQDSRPDREQQLLLEQLQPVRRGLGRRRRRSRCRSARACGSPAATTTSSATTTSTTTGAAARCCSRCPTSSSAGRPGIDPTRWPAATRPRCRPRPRTATSSTATSWAVARRDGPAERHRRRHERPHGLLVGPVPRQHRQLLARQHRQGRHAVERHEHAAGAAAAVACDSTSIGTVGPQQEPELLNCLADIEFDTNACPWFTTPSKPEGQSEGRVGYGAGRSRRSCQGGGSPLCCRASRCSAGCGGSSQREPFRATVPASADVGESARSDTCAQWQAAPSPSATARSRGCGSSRTSPVGSSSAAEERPHARRHAGLQALRQPLRQPLRARLQALQALRARGCLPRARGDLTAAVADAHRCVTQTAG